MEFKLEIISSTRKLLLPYTQVCGVFIIFYLFKQPNTVFDRETGRREELPSSFLRPHTHRCPGRANRHLTVTSTFNYRTTQRP